MDDMELLEDVLSIIRNNLSIRCKKDGNRVIVQLVIEDEIISEDYAEIDF